MSGSQRHVQRAIFAQERQLSDPALQKLRDLLSKCEVEFQTSQLYDPSTEEKVEDLELRCSEFRQVDTPEMFDLLQHELLPMLPDANQTFTLVRNDITHIKYTKDGFFKRHRDYLSLTSNSLEEYTALICVTPSVTGGKCAPTVGGETVVYTHGEELKSTATTTPGGVLFFRKDLEHEALKLVAGEKHVLSLNLWGITKQVLADDQRIVHVTFPNDSCSSTAQSTLSTLARTYAIPASAVNQFPNSFLASKLRFAEVAFDGEDTSIIISPCEVASFDEFAVIYKIYMRCYVGPDEMERLSELVEFYQLPHTGLLVRLASSDVISDDPVDSAEFGTQIREMAEASESDLSLLNLGLTLVKHQIELPEEYEEYRSDIFPLRCDDFQFGVGTASLVVLKLVARVVRCLAHKVLVSKLIESRDLVEAEIKAKFISDEVELFSSEVTELPPKEAAHSGSGMYSPDSYSLFEQEIAWVQMSARLLRESSQNIKTEIAQKRAGVSLRPRKRAKTNDPPSPFKPEVDTESDEETKENEIGDIIICATEARTAVVTAAVKAENLPYVSFKIMFVEGMMTYSAGDAFCDCGEAQKLSIRPCFVSLGDYDNILSLEYCGPSRFNSHSSVDHVDLWHDVPVPPGSDAAAVFREREVYRGKSHADDHARAWEHTSEEEKNLCAEIAAREKAIQAEKILSRAGHPLTELHLEMHKRDKNPSAPAKCIQFDNAKYNEWCNKELEHNPPAMCLNLAVSLPGDQELMPYIINTCLSGDGYYSLGLPETAVVLPHEMASCTTTADDDRDVEVPIPDEQHLHIGSCNNSKRPYQFYIDGKEGRTFTGWNALSDKEQEPFEQLAKVWNHLKDRLESVTQVDGERRANEKESHRQAEAAAQSDAQKRRLAKFDTLGVDVIGEFTDSAPTSVGYPYFHYDTHNKTCFTAKESKLASERVTEMSFVQRVLAQLNDIPFMLPQHTTHETDSHFCNETVYGKLNLLMVTGVVKMV